MKKKKYAYEDWRGLRLMKETIELWNVLKERYRNVDLGLYNDSLMRRVIGLANKEVTKLEAKQSKLLNTTAQ